jgi:predicted nucleotidyltransferase
MSALRTGDLGVSGPQIADFCQRWGIKEFALFGSVLRDDLAESDTAWLA